MSGGHTQLLILAFLALTLVVEVARGVYAPAGARSELWPNISSAITATLLQGFHFVAVIAVLNTLLPVWSGALASYSTILIVLCAVLIDDYLNYWVHRMAHTWPWLWRLHKPHHALEHLNTTAALSGNILYTFILPNSTTVPLLFFLGAPQAGLLLRVVKAISGITSHSNLRWDLSLRRWTPARLLMDGVERVLVMQDFHHAHHGIGRLGHSSGNFGNIFSMFDWLHGTGRQPHAIQEKFGLPAGVSIEPWYVRVWWPILRTKERADLRVPTEDTVRYSSMELAMASAVIITADDRAIPVSRA